MSHEKWDDDEIKKRLSNLPTVEDSRTKEEVFERLQKEGVFDDENVQQARKKVNWLPITVGIAALFAIVLIIPSILKEMDPSEESAVTSMIESTEETDMEKSSVIEESTPEESTENEMFQVTMDLSHVKTAVYTEDVEHSVTLPIQFIDSSNKEIPLTIVVEKEQVMEDFGEHEPTKEQLFNTYAQSIPIETVHTHDNRLSLNESEIRRTNYYRLIHLESGTEYLVPIWEQTFSSVVEALEQMQEAVDGYESVILPDIDYSVKESVDRVDVTFSKIIDFTQYDPRQVMQMVEGILLTAASFHKQVQFHQTLQTEWEGFDLTNPLPMPIGSNRMDILH